VDPAVVQLLLPVELLLVAPLLPKRRQRRRKRVCYFEKNMSERLLIQFVEKEESDEDMGFGLFD
jgi:hypothetical protein